MNQESEVNGIVFMEQLSQVRCFVRYLTYHRCMSRLTKKPELLTEASNAFLKIACIAWCNVFGSRKSCLHWSKTIRNMAKEVEQDFKNRIYRSTDLDKKKYQEYQRSIKEMRDKYVAHIDPNWQGPIQYFDNARAVAKEYERWVMDLPLEQGFSCPVLSLDKIIETAEEKVASLAALFSI